MEPQVSQRRSLGTPADSSNPRRVRNYCVEEGSAGWYIDTSG